MFLVQSSGYIADGLRQCCVMFQMQSKDDSICKLIEYYALIVGSGSRFMYIWGFQCGGWPAVPRQDSGNKVRVRGSLMRVFMYVHFYSIGTLHNPIGAVAPWCYTYTSTSRTHRVYAGCLVYYIIGMDGLSPIGLGLVHLCVTNLSPISKCRFIIIK